MRLPNHRDLKLALLSLFLLLPLSTLAAEDLTGVVQDDTSADLYGEWSKSTHTAGYLGEGYIYSPPVAEVKATFSLPLPADGKYQVLISYTANANRSETTLVRIRAADGDAEVRVNQQKTPEGPGIFQPLGEFEFKGDAAVVEISTAGTDKGVIIVDAVRLLTAEQFATAKLKEPKFDPAKIAAKPKTPAKTQAKPKESPAEAAPAFVRKEATRKLAPLTAAALDKILAEHLGTVPDSDLATDAAYIRRLTLDLIGRQPTPDELSKFVADDSPGKRVAAVETLLTSPEFGRNWGAYWSDVISYRTPQPELTFLNYEPLQVWLAERFNKGEGWDQITYDLLTASGKVGDNPAATFVGFHQADKSRLAAETTRVFLSTQIQCAECHDHKFIEMPQETFHHLAAFFVRTQAKLPWNDSNGIVVSSKPAGEHRVPGGKTDLDPDAFGMKKVGVGDSDIVRRAALAEWIVSPENPWFAKAFTNRVWARMLGRGFSEPVDEIGELGDQVLPEVHAAVADHFVASKFDFRSLVRVIAATRAYQRQIHDAAAGEKPFVTMTAGRLRGDEVYQSLVTAIELPNVTPEAVKPSDAIRFPPPPKSTRDLVNEAFGFDPSASQDTVGRSMQQAMFLMNNRQVQNQVDASPASETVLARIVATESDDQKVLTQLYERVLAREPNDKEREIAKRHIERVGNRQAAMEDLMWSLLNSAEFTSRR